MSDKFFLNDFSKKYLAGTTVNKLHWNIFTDLLCENPDNDETCQNVQKYLLDSTVFSPICQNFPPPQRYLKNFLKTFIAKVEEFNVEVNESALDLYTELISRSSDSTESIGYKIYTINDKEVVALKENLNYISNGTTGLCTWQAAFYLTEFCIENADLFSKKKVMELGSGQGLVGLSLIKSSLLTSYCFSDHHPEVLRNLVQNIEQNLNATQNKVSDLDVRYSANLQDTLVEVRFCDWLESDYLDHMDIDIILASDVVYDKDLIAPLVAVLKKLLRSRPSSMAIVASTLRNEETNQVFLNNLGHQGLLYEEVEEVPHSLCYERQLPVQLLKITNFVP